MPLSLCKEDIFYRIKMLTATNNFSAEQRRIAVQRLTALWAFAESGLGGILHALQVPITGFVIGGMAVILISLIAFFSEQNYKAILKSLLIVLIIKAMVSPYTPFPAYIAVGFQGLMGYLLFSLLRINLFSIFLLSVITMLESAIQKLLILTLFYGESFWKAADSLVDLITSQLGIDSVNGSQWVIGIYLLVYFVWGGCIAWMAYKTIKEIFLKKDLMVLDLYFTNGRGFPDPKKRNMKLWGMIAVLVIISVLLFVFAADKKQGWIAVLKTLSWTSAAILLWYFFVSPLITKFIRQILLKKKSRYSEEVANALSFLPDLKQLSYIAWQKSGQYRGWRRLRLFSSTMINWSLTGSTTNSSLNKPS